jgi:hypothetical protein
MAGIDDIGGQVYPGGEDSRSKNIFGFVNDGEFYHYALGKLGSSLGALNPRMRGRTMCEILGIMAGAKVYAFKNIWRIILWCGE